MMGRIYTIGDTPEKSWQHVPGRALWTVLTLLAGIATFTALQDLIAGARGDVDSPVAILPLALTIVFAVITAHAAYRARMTGRFADENPDLFQIKPAPSASSTPATGAGLFADPLQVPNAAPRIRQFCPYCGEKTAPDYRFCAFCGRALPREEAQASPEPDAQIQPEEE